MPAKDGGKGGKKQPLAITNGEESDDSMPTLQTVSDSSEEEKEYDDDDDYFHDGDDDSEGSDDEYDEDEEDELRDLLREAMDTAVASSDFYNNRGPAPEFDALAEERKGNPFLKLLGSLRGELPTYAQGYGRGQMLTSTQVACSRRVRHCIRRPAPSHAIRSLGRRLLCQQRAGLCGPHRVLRPRVPLPEVCT